MTPQSTSPPALAHITALLRHPASWPDTARAAHQAGDVMHTELLAAGLWDQVSPADRAAIHWAMVAGSDVDQEQQPEHVPVVLHQLTELARHVSLLCEHASYPSTRQREVNHAREILRRLAALPEGWRVEAMRRALGGEALPSVIGEAQITMNRLRSRFGIDARGESRSAALEEGS